MAKCCLGIDVGTSGTKALLLTTAGNVVATATAEHPIHFPKPGWSEQNPLDWWDSTRKAVKTVMRKAKLAKTDVVGVGLSGQMHGSVFLDAAGQPLCNALLWNDQRTAAECDEIEQRVGGRMALIDLVQNIALTGYTAPKILWLRNHKKSVFRKVKTILLPKDYINYRLTGALRCEVSDAAGTLLLDVKKRQWSQETLDKLELDPELLPPVVESPEIIGTLNTDAAKALGLQRDIPVVAGAGDQAAAAIGTGVVKSGVVSATIGTSGVVFAHSAKPVANEEGLLQAFCHAVPGAWCVFGCMLSAGGSLQWLRETLYADAFKTARTDAQRDKLYTQMIDEAAKADARKDAEPLLFHPYLTGERCPYPHPHARGAFVGLTRQHTRGDFVRAVLGGITLNMDRQLEIMREMGVPIREVRLAGGGARNAWWRQLQADVYGAPCKTMRSEEGSALGAAILAAVGAGAFKSVPEASAKAAQVQRTLKPNKTNGKRYAHCKRRMRETYERLEPLYRAGF